MGTRYVGDTVQGSWSPGSPYDRQTNFTGVGKGRGIGMPPDEFEGGDTSEGIGDGVLECQSLDNKSGRVSKR